MDYNAVYEVPRAGSYHAPNDAIELYQKRNTKLFIVKTDRNGDTFIKSCLDHKHKSDKYNIM